MANGAPTPRKAAAAKAAAAEAPDATVSFEWRGITLTRPAKLPASLAFDLADMAESTDFSVVVRLLTTVIGAEQFTLVRAKIAEDGDSLDDLANVLQEFLTLALAPGSEPGE